MPRQATPQSRTYTHTPTHVENRETRTKQEKRLKANSSEAAEQPYSRYHELPRPPPSPPNFLKSDAAGPRARLNSNCGRRDTRTAYPMVHADWTDFFLCRYQELKPKGMLKPKHMCGPQCTSDLAQTLSLCSVWNLDNPSNSDPTQRCPETSYPDKTFSPDDCRSAMSNMHRPWKDARTKCR